MINWLTKRWYSAQPPPAWLLPLERLFSHKAQQRRRAYQQGQKASYRAPVPVIVVGNISVGGTGKTPFTLWLLERLKQKGYRPGVVSRGYGGKAPEYPFIVTSDSSAHDSGDEPLMLAMRGGCPVVVDPDRARAARALLEHSDCDLIISDDGLQHYALARDLEIVLIDGGRGLGNRHCLPAGPLRETPERLLEADFVVVNGAGYTPESVAFERMQLQPQALHNLQHQQVDLGPQAVHAVAGIGHPERFFETLRGLGFSVQPHPFADHHAFCAEDLQFGDELAVIMTEKDAVKCRAFAADNRYYLPVQALLSEAFELRLLARIEQLLTA